MRYSNVFILKGCRSLEYRWYENWRFWLMRWKKNIKIMKQIKFCYCYAWVKVAPTRRRFIEAKWLLMRLKICENQSSALVSLNHKFLGKIHHHIVNLYNVKSKTYMDDIHLIKYIILFPLNNIYNDTYRKQYELSI